ncbi:MAG: hypothetical protein JW772_05745 [Candidatus Diapherotrites archaeon]|nr:hypothetical protein [Candidatus Diapherotrites archaeon]
MDRKLLLQLVGLFIIAQAIGLFVGYNLIAGIESGDIEQPGFVNDNPDDPINAIGLVLYILFGTVVFLIALKFFKGGHFFKAFELFIVFITAWIVFEFALGEPAGITLAILLVISRLVWKKKIWLRNLTALIATSTVGALVGVTLGVIPVIIFIILLAAYDYIAVFKTKHMVTLAKGISGKNLAFTLAMPTPKHTFELGTGDFVVPLAFATSAMRDSMALGFPNYFIIALLILFGSIVGLFFTMEYLQDKIGKALPALPLQTAIMLAFFGMGKLVGF